MCAFKGGLKLIYYGHTKENPVTKELLPKEHWQLLKDHLNNVGMLAEERAKKFGAGKLGKIIGLGHDVGKYSYQFQKRLEGDSQKVDHSTAGAQEIIKKNNNKIGKALSFTIAGHHGGIPDGHKGAAGNLPERLAKKDIPDYHSYRTEIELPGITNKDLLKMPTPKSIEMDAFSFSFCIRMLYSCLVDADYLDTERFMAADKFVHRPENVSIDTIYRRLGRKIDELTRRNKESQSLINNARQDILQRCLLMAESKPGLYTLTVPTGGGKTYSSLAFGLKHAVTHGKTRVIYVIPYTSIIEQNAQVFRDALENATVEDNVVLEHQSNFIYPEGSFDDWDNHEKAHRLAAENWDMPVIVTTTVQFFESLYSNKGSRCRKLHNMVNSVIILDEAQMLPIEYLKPCLWALAELVLNYGATVVLCTATQPAVKELLPANLRPIEIMEDPVNLQKIFKRVTVEYLEQMLDEDLALAMSEHSQVLTIVNTRRHARLLFDKLLKKTQDGVYHLSARMCPAHRKQILAEIRQALHENQPCRVVSTQLIEAGVDVDFPCVYRTAAGIDSIAQAAGRCNREGKRELGRVTVFNPEPHGMPQKGRFSAVAGLMRSTARRLEHFENDLISLSAIEDYFKNLIDLVRLQIDDKAILKMIKESKDDLSFPFATIADKFQLIDSEMISVVVPFDEKAKELMNLAETSKYPASMARLMQPYVVQVYQYELAALEKEGVIRNVGNCFKFVIDSSFYDDRFGLKDAKEVTAPCEVLMF